MRQVTVFLLCVLMFLGAFFSIRSSIGPTGRGHAERGSEAMDALDFWTRSRAYPNRDIPAAQYFKAYQLAKAKHKELPQIMTAGSVWDPIGPLNLQGRSLAVAVNPLNSNTIYLGTASGGLWRSHTAGLGGDWHQVKLGFPALGVSAIVIDPVDSNCIYIGTGEVYGYQSSNGGLVTRTMRGSYGIGILKTTNGGATWTRSLDWSYNQQRGVQMLKLNPLNRHTIWAATSEGLYKSMDDGETWGLLSSLPILLAEDIVIHPADTNKVLASFGNLASPNSGVYRSNNGGDDWARMESFPEFKGKSLLCMYAGNPDMVYASVAYDSTTDLGALWMTNDFGYNWSLVYDYSGKSLYQVQGWYSHFVVVHPTDPNQIIVNSVNRSKSTDGGSTFSTIGSGYSDNHGYAIDPHNPNIVYVANDDGIYRSTNFGASYVNIGYGMQSGQIYNGFSCSASDSTIALSQSQDHIPGYRYLGSMDWDHGSASDEAGWTAIDPSDDHIMYAVSRYGQSIIKSTDRGATFFASGYFEGSGAWNSPVVVAPSNPNILYFGDRRIRRSANKGGSWSATNGGNMLDGNPVLSIAVAPGNENTVYAGTAPLYTNAHIYRTTNGGSSWTNVTGSLPDRYPMDLAVDPLQPLTVYLAMGGFGSGHFFKSTDGGATWTDKSGTLPDAPTTAIAIDPLNNNVLFVGNDLGVNVSTDAGATWASFNAGLPDAVIAADLTISPSSNTLRVATHGNGIWERALPEIVPANYFDYKAVSIDYPVNGEIDSLGVAFSGIRASVRNLSAQAITDSFDLKFKILTQGVEIFSQTLRLPGLDLAETRQITFGGTFVPPDTGSYEFLAIIAAGDQVSINDTLRGTLTIVPAPTVRYYVVTKISSPYVDLAAGDAGPAGDDAQSSIPLPFPFKFDGFYYTTAQISTNGWMEFGAGTAGTLRGVSTDGQLGGYFKASLGTTERPTKALGPWWADLATNSTGQITYGAAGSAPNRVFTVEWKNMPAFYDPSTTTLLNFQIKLYEAHNILEFCYGPVVPGNLPGSNGASMGLKDLIGGDYRFIDLSTGALGAAGEIRTDLNPYADWPGQNSAFRIETDIRTITGSLSQGWNMVSLPLTLRSQTPASAFPTYIAGSAFQYVGAYQTTDLLRYGKGYWVKSSAASPLILHGTALSSVLDSLHGGWNLIGSVDHEIPIPSDEIVISNVYSFTGAGYSSVSTLTPGYGYWIKAGSDGAITLGTPVMVKNIAGETNPSCSLVIADARGGRQTLFLTDNTAGTIDINRWEMPPPPPKGVFDARFSTQRMMEGYSLRAEGDRQYPIQLQSAAYPLTISYRTGEKTGQQLFLEELSGETLLRAHALTGTGSITIATSNVTLRVRASGVHTIPAQFALRQNYPNPFNPSTKVGFDLPARSMVRLTLYDLLGKELKTIADGEYDAGSYSLQVDCSDLASGLYIYRLSAGNYTAVKKMLLVR